MGDPRVQLIRHARNSGVGAAIVTGYRLALDEPVEAFHETIDRPRNRLELVAGELRGDANVALAWIDLRQSIRECSDGLDESPRDPERCGDGPEP